MLSELCVRRPVFATMLVMSLVVLGIFSFRGLGVDLFPKADPATVNVVAVAARAPAPTRCRRRWSSRWRRRSAASRASTRSQARITEGRAPDHRPLRARARPQRRVERRPREGGRARSGRVPPTLLPPVITKVDPDADPVMSLIVSSDVDEPAHADRAGRQADRPGHPDGQRRRRGQPRAAAAPARSTSSSTSRS